ncbi:SPOR domain-containing protein [Robiginitalea sp. M366]|uniref:HU domain-containing protein n=1 Tax=Robiginitalea aestuariiviva TaxID=3036903 RepID=UPI00240D60AB|nr:SPOR domain-containing protein [Robiginitalea aestuariiviva]MDG1571434.1 SPOR domain-containing protein [Robiginitalea aestuariiviva]
MPERLNFSIFAYMGLSEYIDALLYRYPCVVVPAFGAFLTQNKPAYLQKESSTFYPPSKALSFNGQLKSNDGLLVNHIAQAEQRPFEEILERVQQKAREWSRTLHAEGELELLPLGTFKKEAEGNIRFEPRSKSNYLTASFGLASLVANPVSREVMKEEVSEMEQRIPFSITPEARNTPGLRPLLKYAAVVLLALSAGISGFSFYQQQGLRYEQVWNASEQEVTRTIEAATFFSTSPLELPAITLELERPKAEKVHHIIAGAFRYRQNADKKIRQLQRQGYAEAFYVGTNPYGLHQVAYGSYSDAQEALAALREIKRTVSPDAWLLSQK